MRSKTNTWPKPFLFLLKVFIGITLLVSVCACLSKARKEPFNPRHCMASIPNKVPGLVVAAGPRTEASIIRDMVPAICNGHVLFNSLQKKDTSLKSGYVVLQIVVEYTGEVNAAEVIETSIPSKHFLRKVSDFIMDTDFVNWVPGTIDTVFIYPAHFGE